MLPKYFKRLELVSNWSVDRIESTDQAICRNDII